MTRKLVTAVSVGAGALTFFVYVASGGDVAQQTTFLAGAGLGAPNRDATCQVRLDPAVAAAAGVGVYQRLKFPVVVTTLTASDRDVQMPPMPQGGRQALDVPDWNDCTLAASTGPVAALWGTSQPFTLAGVTKPWCRQKTASGLPCLLLDGGTYGDRNVSLCAARADPATCERVSGGTVYAGDDPEDL